jgi:hypothetical protein
MKTMVEEVLEETGFREQRAAKMSVDDLLKYDPIPGTPILLILYPLPGCFQHFMT